MFKFIKRILIFFIAAFMALFLFACVSTLLDPNAQEEQQRIEQAQAEAELKKKEQEEREEEVAKEAASAPEVEKATLVETVEYLIPDKYKDSMYYDVFAGTPTDTSLKGLILNINLSNGLFNEEKDCRDAAVFVLEKIKDVPNISIVSMSFFDNENKKYNLNIEDWETYKEKGIDGNTLEFIEQQ